jgi:hypothetical protein
LWSCWGQFFTTPRPIFNNMSFTLGIKLPPLQGVNFVFYIGVMFTSLLIPKGITTPLGDKVFPWGRN